MYVCFRKLDLLQPGLQETISVAFQTMMTFLIFTVLAFYYEWRLALFHLFNFPLGMMGTALFQLVSDYTYRGTYMYVHVISVNHPNFPYHLLKYY